MVEPLGNIGFHIDFYVFLLYCLMCYAVKKINISCMRNIFFLFILCFPVAYSHAQILSTSNQPSQVWPGGGIATGKHVYGVFAGRTPCQEFIKELNMDPNPECAKRKMNIILYQDSITGKPTTYETKGMGKWSGKGNWTILQGTPTNPRAMVFQIKLDANTSLFLLKGDDNVLFILDRNKNFLVGNEKFSYTLNRARN